MGDSSIGTDKWLSILAIFDDAAQMMGLHTFAMWEALSTIV